MFDEVILVKIKIIICHKEIMGRKEYEKKKQCKVTISYNHKSEVS